MISLTILDVFNAGKSMKSSEARPDPSSRLLDIVLGHVMEPRKGRAAGENGKGGAAAGRALLAR